MSSSRPSGWCSAWRAGWLSIVLAAACSGGFGHRDVAVLEGALELPPEVLAVRFEGANGSVRALPADDHKILYKGGLRLAAESRATLELLQQMPATITLAPSPEDPTLWILRGPEVPAGVDPAQAVVGFEVTIHLPADLPLTIAIGGSGHLVAEQWRAPLRLETQRGDLRAMGCHGTAILRTGKGNTIVYDHVGDLDVQQKAGDMQVFVRGPQQEIRLVTGFGNVQCLIPPDAGFRVDARSETGKMANGFGLPIERPSAYSAVMLGSRGDGATAIVMRTGTGHLSLSHKVFDPR